MNLSNATNGAVNSDSQGLGTITNDDSVAMVMTGLPFLNSGDLFLKAGRCHLVREDPHLIRLRFTSYRLGASDHFPISVAYCNHHLIVGQSRP